MDLCDYLCFTMCCSHSAIFHLSLVLKRLVQFFIQLKRGVMLELGPVCVNVERVVLINKIKKIKDNKKI